MLSIWSGLLIALPIVGVHVGVDIHIPVVWLVLPSATVGIAHTVGPQVGIIIVVVVDGFDETVPNDISTLEGAFEVIELEARDAFGELTVGAGTQVLIFVNWLATRLFAAAAFDGDGNAGGPLFLPLLLSWPDTIVKFKLLLLEA